MQNLGCLSADVVRGAGKACEGAWGIIPWDTVLNNPESQAFKKALLDAFGPGVEAQESDVTAMGYMAMKSLLLAMQKAHSDTDVKAIDRALFKLDWVTPLGWKWQLEQNGSFLYRELFITHVKHGKLGVAAAMPKYR